MLSNVLTQETHVENGAANRSSNDLAIRQIFEYRDHFGGQRREGRRLEVRYSLPGFFIEAFKKSSVSFRSPSNCRVIAPWMLEQTLSVPLSLFERRLVNTR